MAELVLGPAAKDTVSNLISLASEQLKLALGWKGDLNMFCRSMAMVRDVLRRADENKVSSNHSDLTTWLQDLRDIADEADDLLEEVAYENLRRQLEHPKWKKVRGLCTRSNPLLFRLRIANKVKDLKSRLAVLNVHAAQLGLQHRLAAAVDGPMADPPETNSFLTSHFVGREEDLAVLESLLVDSSGLQHGLTVVAIVGMPGLGKTTLAKAVCKTDKICQKFGENVLWVCVSKNFETMWILKEILQHISTDGGVNVNSEETAMKKIQQVLGEKNFLLILDDVWNEDRQKWERLRSCLLGVSNKDGNRVLVTSRSESVAEVMVHTKEHIHRPKVLGDDVCWTIINQRVFGCSSVPHEFIELEAIGKKISEKCKGVPLVANLVGATLQNKKSIQEWQSILKNQMWRSLAKENKILDIIQFSYDRLPELALKQCFAFCSIFPEDYVMEKEELIQVWMAEGFLQPAEERSMEMESIGDRYFKYLLSYSLFQAEDKDVLGRVTSCKMHDSIRDFAESVSNSEILIFNDEFENNISTRIRHLNLIGGGRMMQTVYGGDVALNLRTLLSSKHDTPNIVQSDMKRLRVLSVCNTSDAEQLSKCFRKSKSLRYLDISHTKLKEFPKFIKKLYSLQTFRYMYCNSLEMPPDGLEDLVNLRHLYFNNEDLMPAKLGRLTNLQTLSMFVVGTVEGRKIEELGSLSKLRGRLEINNLHLVKSRLEAEKAKLHEKKVDELALRWKENEGDYDEDVLEGFLPHSSLQILYMGGFGSKILPSWLLRCHLSNLVKLTIQSCPRLESIPVMGGFSCLKQLRVRSCNELIDAAFAFQSLEDLTIDWCPKLESISNRGLSSLEKLRISCCGVVSVSDDDLSTCTRLKEFSLRGCHKLKSLPNLHGLSFLLRLKIRWMNALMYLPNGLSSCTALKVLEVFNCPNLVSVPEELKRLSSLEELRIRYCPKLSSFSEEMLGFLSNLKRLLVGGFSNEWGEFPGFSSIHHLHSSLELLALIGWEKLTQLPNQIQALTALKELWISQFHGVEVMPKWLGNFSCLTSLFIRSCSGLRTLESGLLLLCTGLKRLVIMDCNNLISVPGELEELRSLVRLEIYRCPKLRSFPEGSLGCLSSLKTLEIGGFSEELEEFIGMSSIHPSLPASLEELTLHGWEKLTQLPQQIQYLTALRKLEISDFKGVEALPDWVGNLPSLQQLSIFECTNLKILPSAEAIKRLSKVDRLYTHWTELKEKIQQEKKSGSQNQ